jgi:hypothetical protein
LRGNVGNPELNGIASDSRGEKHVLALEFMFREFRRFTLDDRGADLIAIDRRKVVHLDEVPEILASKCMNVDVRVLHENQL